MAHLIFDQRNQAGDRRSWDAVAVFPMVDDEGHIIHEDRRKNAERRGYQLEEIVAENDDFRNVLQQ